MDRTNFEAHQGETVVRLEHRPAIGAIRNVIARRAYQIWQSRGCPDGTADDDWRQAEVELRRTGVLRSGTCEKPRHLQLAGCDSMIDEAAQESFPASDPPSWTHCAVP